MQATATEVVKGVHLVDTYANTYIVTDQRMVLVDTSSEEQPKKIFDALQGLGIQPRDLTSILVTHVHPDHATGLRAIHDRYPARVACHELEAPFIEQKKQYPGPPKPSTHRPVAVDVRLKDGQTFEDFHVLHTPGHTPGHMSLYDARRRLLIAGDALRTEGRVGPMEDVFNADPLQHRASIKRLAELDVETLVCGHGPPIRSGAAQQIQAFVRTLP